MNKSDKEMIEIFMVTVNEESRKLLMVCQQHITFFEDNLKNAAKLNNADTNSFCRGRNHYETGCFKKQIAKRSVKNFNYTISRNVNGNNNNSKSEEYVSEKSNVGKDTCLRCGIKQKRRSTRLQLDNSILVVVLFSFLISTICGKNINITIPANIEKTLNPESDSADSLFAPKNSTIVPGNFKYCTVDSKSDPIDLGSICKLPKYENYPNLAKSKKALKAEFKQLVEDKEFSGMQERYTHNGPERLHSINVVTLDVYSKEIMSVIGMAYECLYYRKKYKFHESLTFGKYSQDWIEYISVTDHECHNMVKHKRCGFSKGEMKCDSLGTCTFDGTVTPEYKWISDIFMESDHCVVKERELTAVNSKSKVFGSCKVEDNYCVVGYSTYVWEEKIVHTCPFRRVIKQQEFEVLQNGFKNNEFAFVYAGLTDYCGSKLIKTDEGAFVRFSDFANDSFYKLTGFDESKEKLDLKEITELTIATIDRNKLIETKEAKELFLKSCENFQKELILFSYTKNKSLRVKDYNNKEWILFTGPNEQLITGKCFDVDYVKISKIYTRCSDSLKIKFLHNNTSRNGYLQTNGVIVDKHLTQKTCTRKQMNSKNLYHTKTDLVIEFLDGKTKVIYKDSLKRANFKYLNGMDDVIQHKTILDEEFSDRNSNNGFEDFEINRMDKREHIMNTINRFVEWSKRQTLIVMIAIPSIVIVVILVVSTILIKIGMNPCALLYSGIVLCCRCSASYCVRCGRFYIDGCCKNSKSPVMKYDAAEAVVTIEQAPAKEEIYGIPKTHEDQEKYHRFIK